MVVIGVLVSGYLTYSKVANVETVCPQVSTGFNCDLVQNSVYSRIAGIPIVFPGLAAYVTILAVLLLEGRIGFLAQRGPLLIFGITLFGFLYSGYLTSVEAFVLHAWCMWCVISAITMTTLFVLSSVRAWRQFSIVDEEMLDSED